MSLAELFAAAYRWADSQAPMILAAGVAIPALGTLVAWIGKGGRTDAEGRLVASLLVGFGLCVFVLEVLSIVVAHLAFGHSMVDANVILLLAPVICLAGCLWGIRAVFPLNQLASVQTFTDVGLFVLACLFVLWLFSRFRGWGIVFWGDLGQLAIIGVLGYLMLKRLYRRAFKGR